MSDQDWIVQDSSDPSTFSIEVNKNLIFLGNHILVVSVSSENYPDDITPITIQAQIRVVNIVEEGETGSSADYYMTSSQEVYAAYYDELTEINFQIAASQEVAANTGFSITVEVLGDNGFKQYVTII